MTDHHNYQRLADESSKGVLSVGRFIVLVTMVRLIILFEPLTILWFK